MKNYLKYTYYRNTMGNLVINFTSTKTNYNFLSSRGTLYVVEYSKVEESYTKIYDSDAKMFYEYVKEGLLEQLYNDACERGLIPEKNIFPVKELQAQLDYLKEELLLIINIK